jgi:hypothetical protein
MRRAIIALVFVVTGTHAAQAGTASIHSLGRHLGLGWSDGYHAREKPQTWGWHDASPAPPPAKMLPPAATTKRPGKPALPSQRMTQRPVYWHK